MLRLNSLDCTPPAESCYSLDLAPWLRLCGCPVTGPPPAASLRPSTLLHTLQTRCLSLSEAENERDVGRREFLSWPTVYPGGDTWQGDSWSWTRQAASWSPLLSTLHLEGYSHAFEATHLSRFMAPIPVKAAQTKANGLACFLACISEVLLGRPEAESFSLNPLCFVVLLQPGLHKRCRLSLKCACVSNYMFLV